MTEEEGERWGLVPTHAYAVLDIREYKVALVVYIILSVYTHQAISGPSYSMGSGLSNFQQGELILLQKKKSQIDVCEKMFLLFTWFVSLSTYQVKFVYKDDHKGTMGLSYYCGCTFSVSFNFSSALYWLRDGVWGEIRLMTFILYWPCCSADICNTGELNISIWIEFSPANRLCRYLWSF